MIDWKDEWNLSLVGVLAGYVSLVGLIVWLFTR
jgi:hypothetical protein